VFLSLALWRVLGCMLGGGGGGGGELGISRMDVWVCVLRA